MIRDRSRSNTRAPAAWLAVLLGGLLPAAAHAGAEVQAATASECSGDVKVTRGKLANGGAVMARDKVTTRAGSARLSFRDHTELAVGRNSVVDVESFTWDPGTRKGQLTAKVLKGQVGCKSGGLVNPANPRGLTVKGSFLLAEVTGTDFILIIDPAAVATPPAKVGREVEAGPLWSNDDAAKKCPKLCAPDKFTGAWTTTVPGKMSVCGCVSAGPADRDADSIPDARDSCPDQAGVASRVPSLDGCPAVAERIIVVPDANGHVGGVIVRSATTGAQIARLDKPFASAGAAPDGTPVMPTVAETAERIAKTFPDVLPEAKEEATLKEAGPLWNHKDATRKCPGLCAPDAWNGGWHTTVPNEMSVCHCAKQR